MDLDALAGGLDAAVIDLRTALLPRRAELSLTAAATLGRLRMNGPTRLTDLAVAEGITQPAMTTLVNRLVDQGLVTRGGDPSDGRVVLLDITPAGIDVLARRRDERAARLHEPLAALSPEDAQAIAAALPALTRLADAVRRPAPLEVTR